MRQFKLMSVALGVALLVSACGGGGDGNQAPAVKYSSVVSFGDSLSDAGTYNVGPIKAMGGGLFTVNGIAGAVGANPVPSYTWAQLISAAAVGSVSCAARNGGFGVAEISIAGCTDYAQGGSRVTSPLGVGNAVGVGYIAGPLTEPVVTQVASYLTDAGGSFTGKELVTVLAGANDLFGQTDKLLADATAAGSAAAGPAFVGSVTTALVSGTGAAPVSAAAAIQTAMGTAMATAAAAPGATTTTIFTAGGNAGVSTAAANGNTAVMNVAGITAYAASAQSAANAAFGPILVGGLVQGLGANQATAVPAISAAMTTASALATATTSSIVTAAVTAAIGDATAHSYANANIANAATIGTAAATAGSNAFVTSMVGSLTTGATAAPAGAAGAISTAMGNAITAAAAAPGATNTSIFTAATNAGVMTAAGAGNTDVMNMAFIGSVMGTAQAAATTAGSNAGNAYGAGAGAQAAVGGMVTAANELVASIKGMVAKGATHIVVANLPDVSQTPMAKAQAASSQALILAMTTAFNQALQTGLTGTQGVLFVDVFAENQRQMANPLHYALDNITGMACDLTKSPTGNSLGCKTSNLIAGDTSHYMFADSVHPTPYGHKLLSQYVTKAMVIAGWL